MGGDATPEAVRVAEGGEIESHTTKTRHTTTGSSITSLSSEYLKMKRTYAMIKQQRKSSSHRQNLKQSPPPPPTPRPSVSVSECVSVSESSPSSTDQNTSRSILPHDDDDDASFIGPPSPPDSKLKVCTSTSTNSNTTAATAGGGGGSSSSSFEEAKQKFIRDIKTAGIRGMKEKTLLHSFHTIMISYQDSIRTLSSTLDQWKSHVHDLNDYWNTMVQEWKQKYHNQKIVTTQQLRVEETNRTYEERIQSLQHDMTQCHIEKEEIIQHHKVQMNDFLNQMECKVNTFHEQMNIERKRKKNECEMKERYDREKEQEIYDLKHSFHTTHEEWMTQKTQFEHTIHENLCTMNEQGIVINQLSKKVKDLESTLHQTQEELNKMKNTVVVEYDDFKVRREEELVLVEERIQRIIALKDQKIHVAECRARKAEERADAFETCISNIESGFERMDVVDVDVDVDADADAGEVDVQVLPQDINIDSYNSLG